MGIIDVIKALAPDGQPQDASPYFSHLSKCMGVAHIRQKRLGEHVVKRQNWNADLEAGLIYIQLADDFLYVAKQGGRDRCAHLGMADAGPACASETLDA